MFHVPNEHRLSPADHPILGSTDDAGNQGFFVFGWRGYQIRCQASDGEGWEHVSVSTNRKRTPTWEIMCYVKSLFWDPEDAVVQFHPPGSEYINQHEFCLHLWRPTGQGIQLPPSHLVGTNKQVGVIVL